MPSEKSPSLVHSAPILADYISRENLAQELQVSSRTLDRWHGRRIGPPRCLIGRKVFYRRVSVRDWLISREQAEVAET